MCLSRKLEVQIIHHAGHTSSRLFCTGVPDSKTRLRHLRLSKACSKNAQVGNSVNNAISYLLRPAFDTHAELNQQLVLLKIYTLLVKVLQAMQRRCQYKLFMIVGLSQWQITQLVILEPVRLITDEQVTGCVALESVSVKPECLVGHNQHLQ